MIDRLLNLLASVQARIAAGFAMLVAMATLLTPTKDWTFSLPAALSFAATFSVWIVAELRSASVRYPHDVKLAELLFERMTVGERATLRTMDFAEDFQWTEFSGLREIGSTWDGPDYQFLDPRLQRAWAPVLAGMIDFRRELARRTAPKRGAPNWFTVKTALADHDGEMSHQSREDAEYLNVEATKIIEQLDSFFKIAKRRLDL